MRAELEEEVEHLADVGGVSVGVEEGEAGVGLPPEGGHHPVPYLGLQLVHLNVPVRREPQQAELPLPIALPEHLVRRRLRREEREPRSH